MSRCTIVAACCATCLLAGLRHGGASAAVAPQWLRRFRRQGAVLAGRVEHGSALLTVGPRVGDNLICCPFKHRSSSCETGMRCFIQCIARIFLRHVPPCHLCITSFGVFRLRFTSKLYILEAFKRLLFLTQNDETWHHLNVIFSTIS